MALSLSSLVRKRSEKPPRIVIYGVPGVGKTSLAAEFPSPIFLQTEEGSGNLELTTFTDEPFTTFEQFEQAIELLYSGEHDFKTVVVDSISWLEPIIWAETCKRNKWSSIEDPGFGRGYIEADATWRRFLTGMNALRDHRGMTLLYLAHEEIKTFSDPERDSYDRYRLRVNRRGADMIVEHADAVGFMNYVTMIRNEKSGFNKETAKGTGSGQRAIYWSERPAFTAKNRFDMPDQILINRGAGYSALAPYLPGHRSATADAANAA